MCMNCLFSHSLDSIIEATTDAHAKNRMLGKSGLRFIIDAFKLTSALARLLLTR